MEWEERKRQRLDLGASVGAGGHELGSQQGRSVGEGLVRKEYRVTRGSAHRRD